MYQVVYESPLGTMLLKSSRDAVVGLDFLEEEDTNQRNTTKIPPILKQTIQELDDYFCGTLFHFTVPINQEGTMFQQSVWSALGTIPYGETKSYEDIAYQIGNPKAVRAVGMTNGKNSIGIIVPCHRVIGKNGKMVGYASGIWRKKWLLAHEQKYTT